MDKRTLTGNPDPPPSPQNTAAEGALRPGRGLGRSQRVIELFLGRQAHRSDAATSASAGAVCVRPDDDLRSVLETIQRTIHKIALVVDENGRLKGTITDGDFRRAVLNNFSFEGRACEVMNGDFIAVDPSFSPAQIKRLMDTNGVEQIPIVDAGRRLRDIVSVWSLQQRPAKRTNPVLILAGGQGKRLRPLTDVVPKPMLPVQGRPVIERLVEQLTLNGFSRIFIAVNYLGHIIEEYLKDGSQLGCNLKYVREERELGTAGPLRLIAEEASDPVIVVNGDLVTSVSFSAFADFHAANRFDLSIGVANSSFQVPFGVVSANSRGEVSEISEKPVQRFMINAGPYMVEPSFIRLIPQNQNYPMTEFISTLLEQKAKVGAFPIHESWLDMGLPENYARAQQSGASVESGEL